jgi:hypothetical protein
MAGANYMNKQVLDKQKMTVKMHDQRVIRILDNRCLLCLSLILVLLTPISIANASIATSDKSKLSMLIAGVEDPLMTINDLAFLLVTHDFDAVPKGDYVEVHLDNAIYKLVPNNRYPGLANMTLES